MRRLFLAVLLWVAPAAAIEELIIGPGGIPWTAAADSTGKLSIAPDSIWTWPVADQQNIAPLIRDRGGEVFTVVVSEGAFGQTVRDRSVPPGIEKIIDGDSNTAFNPDEVDLAREVDLYIDLGGHYGIEQIRFFPRLDAEHRDDYLQAFQLGHNREDPGTNNVALLPYSFLINANINSPNTQSIVLWPRPNEPSDDKEMRHIRIRTLNQRAWEIAEVEITANGTVAPAEFVSRALAVPGGAPVWGRLRINDRDAAELPITVQTRTGPDPDPIHYFVNLTKSKTLRLVTRQGWENIVTLSEVERGEAERGPILPNPLWSAWETVTEGLILSPSPQEFIQFRVAWNDPGIKIETMAFEHTNWPLAEVLEAEINPAEAPAGSETEFVLSLQVQRRNDTNIPASGFRHLQIFTPAEITGVDRVLVKDIEALFKIRQDPGRGFQIELWDRIDPGASFIEIFFRGRIFADGTLFRVQALDQRATPTETETVYQFARAGNVDPLTPSATLAVRLNSHNDPLLDDLRSTTRIFTPNSDGINDFLLVSYNLLRLTRPAPVFFEIYDLRSNKVRQGFAGADQSGRFARVWDGRDRDGFTVPPGLYLYQVEVEADADTFQRQGVVSVAY
jgi:hypothetical protein